MAAPTLLLPSVLDAPELPAEAAGWAAHVPSDSDEALGTNVVLDAGGAATVQRLMEEAPGPSAGMLRLFGDESA